MEMEPLKKHVKFILSANSEGIQVVAKGTYNTRRMPYFVRRRLYEYPLISTVCGYGIQYFTKENDKIFGAAYDSTHDFPPIIPEWLLEYEEFYNWIEPLLYVKSPVLRFADKANPERIEKYTGIKVATKKVNIDGRITGIDIIIDMRNDEFQKTIEDYNNETFPVMTANYRYSRIKYPASFIYQGVKDSSFIISYPYKQLIKADKETAKKLSAYFIENTRMKMGINNPAAITGKNLEKLFKLNNSSKEIDVRIYNKSGRVLRFLNIRDLVSEPDNDTTLHKILTALDKNKSYYENNKIYYAFNPEEVRQSKKVIMDYLIKKDLKQFLDKLQTVSKSLDTNKSAIKSLKEKGFIGIPQPHQEVSISWFYKLYRDKVPGAILADEMGMGKTLSAIGFLSLLNSQTKITIICPASVISVWENEIQKFNPTMAKRIGQNINIMSYEKAIRYKIAKTDILILDEGQKVKNNKTQMFKSIATINKRFTIILSGTPIENKIDDLFSLLQLLDSSAYDLFSILKRIYGDEHSIAAKIREIIDPIYLQRKKSKDQLVAKLKINEMFVDATQTEIDLQNQIRKIYSDKLLRIKAKNNHDFYSAQIIMAGIMRSRQAISYPGQLPEELKEHFSKKLQSQVNKLIPSKLMALIKLYKKIKDKNEKVVIFAEYRQTVEYLKKNLEQSGAKVLTLTGSDSSTKRKIMIEEFQKPDTKFDVFVISLKAGATGITLTNANNVVIYDLWYNPAVISQALARVHRIGQIQDVNAYLMIQKQTIDDRIYKIFYNKSELINHFEGSDKETGNVQKAIRDLGKEMFK
jgi:SNF2 family DNA or RNA helicase